MLLSRVKAVRMAVLAEGDPGTTDVGIALAHSTFQEATFGH